MIPAFVGKVLRSTLTLSAVGGLVAFRTLGDFHAREDGITRTVSAPRR